MPLSVEVQLLLHFLMPGARTSGTDHGCTPQLFWFVDAVNVVLRRLDLVHAFSKNAFFENAFVENAFFENAFF